MVKLNLTQLKKHFLAISYSLFLLGFFFFPSSKSHSNFFHATLAFPFLILIFMKKVDLKSFFSSKTFLISALFLVYTLSTLFWADNCRLSDIAKNGRRVLYVLIFLSATMHLIQVYPNFLQRLLMSLCWTASIVAVAYIVFYYSKHPFPISRMFGYGQLYNPIMASSVYGIISIACIYLFQQQRTFKMRLLYLGMCSIFFLYILLSQSRGPLLAWCITVLGWAILESLSREQSTYGHRNNMRLVVLLVSLLGGILFVLYPELLESRLFEVTSHRWTIWKQCLIQLKNAPFFGYGLNAGTETIVQGKKMLHHHSAYLTTLFFGGLVGLLALIALLGSAIWQVATRVKNPQKSLLASMLLFGALCIAIDGHTLIRHPKPVWMFFWFPIAVIAASELQVNPLYSEKRDTVDTGTQ